MTSFFKNHDVTGLKNVRNYQLWLSHARSFAFEEIFLCGVGVGVDSSWGVVQWVHHWLPAAAVAVVAAERVAAD